LPRHQTLGATLDWSYDLLSPLERLVLRRLSVFAGPFPLEVVPSVVADHDVGGVQVMNGLASLVEKSLLVVSNEGATSRSRYRLLDTTRSYAAAKLAEGGETDSIRRRRADCYRELFERIDAGPGEYVDHLDNVRAALEWSFSERGDTRIGVALAAASSRLFLETLLLTECQRWAELAIAAFDESDHGTWREMKLRAALGQSPMFARGNDDRARRSLVKGLTLAEDLGDLRTQLWLLGRLALFDHRIGDIPNASLFATRSAATAARIGDPASIAEANWTLGFLNYYTGELLSAEENWKACLSKRTSSVTDPSAYYVDCDTRARARCGLAAVRWLRGFPEQATKIAKETLAEEATFKDPSTLCICLLMAAATFLRIGNESDAAEVIERLITNARSYSFAPYEAAGIGFSGMLSISRGEPEAGVATLRGAVETLRANRQELQVPVFLGGLAEGLAMMRRFDEALAVIDGVITRADSNKESFFSLAEFWRIKGEILLSASGPDSSAADDYFLRAIEQASRQGALSWQLRAAISLARSAIRHNRFEEARSLLTPVYDRFTEGFGSSDLKAAKLLLDELSAAG
jgi:predicted ATPase